MKKRVFPLLLAAVLMLSSISLPAGAYSAKEKNTADALYQMGLFAGYGESYGLDNQLNRYEGYVLMIRLLGEEGEALQCTAKHPFTDVDADWAEPYVAYAYETGLTKGMDATHFGGTTQMTAQQFATICLRALGYDDVEKHEFSYDAAVDFAKSKDIRVPVEGEIDRGNSVIMLWDTLLATKNGSTRKLANYLIEKGVVAGKDFSKAMRIEREGISAGDKTGEKGTEVEPDTKPGGNTSGSTSGGGGSGSSGGSTSGGSTSGGSGGKPAGHTHRWDSGTVTQEAACLTAGVRTFVCSGCGETREESIPALGHDYMNGECTRCGEKDPDAKDVIFETEEVPW